MPGQAAAESYAQQAQIMEAAVRATAEIWAELDPTRFSESWVRDNIGSQIFLSTARAQELAAMAADVYTDLILAEDGIVVTPDGQVIPASLAGVASDGRDLDSLLVQPLISSSVAQAGGATAAEAMAVGLAQLTRIVGTQVQDAGRAASGISIAARPRTGWVRMVEPHACSRCSILAGRWYRWSDGFLRHPLCKCRNIPAAEDTHDDVRTDPMALFNSLSEEEQNRQFTKAGAQSIRLGANISRVVNARRGALGLSSPGRLTAAEQKALRGGRDIGRLQRVDVYGRPLYTTTEATTARADVGRLLNGKTPRLMPEAIMELAKDRDDAIRLLRRYGYIR